MTKEIIKEMMEKYNENKAKWISEFGTEKGFDAWFTKQAIN
jgi:hypothetical protein